MRSKADNTNIFILVGIIIYTVLYLYSNNTSVYHPEQRKFSVAPYVHYSPIMNYSPIFYDDDEQQNNVSNGFEDISYKEKNRVNDYFEINEPAPQFCLLTQEPTYCSLGLQTNKKHTICKKATGSSVLDRTDIYHIHNQIREYNRLKQRADMLVNKIRKNRWFSEYSLQKLLQVIDAESTIVDYLLRKKRGSTIERIVNTRNKILRKSSPSVQFIYEKIMNVATYGVCDNKRIFLKKMKQCLERYYVVLQDIQYKHTSFIIGPDNM